MKGERERKGERNGTGGPAPLSQIPGSAPVFHDIFQTENKKLLKLLKLLKYTTSFANGPAGLPCPWLDLNSSARQRQSTSQQQTDF